MLTIRELQQLYKLTPLERELWQEVADYWKAHGFSPTLEELAKPRGVYKSTIARKMKNMRRKGYIQWPEGTRRTIRCYPIFDEENCCNNTTETAVG